LQPCLKVRVPFGQRRPSRRPPVPQQTVEDAIAHGEEPTDELLQEVRALDEAPPLSDEELERQALAHPGG
jgi:hypothetical protein